ncbi:MAG: hypothetical protein SV186_02525 [Candidatus Nanohaloarchaea archaeon]|nr:hypothetical protein [Candidatus Nanohaloarchaea archaeon]
MTAGDRLQQGTDRFLRHPEFIVPAVLGSFFSGLIGFTIEQRAAQLSLAGLADIVFLGTMDTMLSVFFTGLLIALILASQEEGERGPWTVAFIRYPALVFASVLYAVAVGIGLLAFIVPGIYIGVRLAFFPFRVVAGESSFTALGQSWDRASGHVLQTGVVLFILSGIGAASFLFLDLFPEGLVEVLDMVYVSLYLPWSTCVLYAVYRDIFNR